MRMHFILLCVLLMAGCAAPTQVAEVPSLPGGVIIPWMEQPRLDGRVSEWAEQMLYEDVFIIDDGSRATGEYPFRLGMGMTHTALNVMVQIESPEENPYNPGEAKWPFWVDLLFGLDQDELVPPSDILSSALIPNYGNRLDEGHWNGQAWVNDDSAGGGVYNDGYPTGGRWAKAWYNDGWLTWEFFIPREPIDPAVDGLDLRPDRVFRLGVTFAVQADTGHLIEHFPHDTLPRGASRTDATEWLRFRVPT